MLLPLRPHVDPEDLRLGQDSHTPPERLVCQRLHRRSVAVQALDSHEGLWSVLGFCLHQLHVQVLHLVQGLHVCMHNTDKSISE